MAQDVELTEIRDFLAQHHPFDDLPEPLLDRLPGQLRVEYFRRGSTIITLGRESRSLYVIRSGAVELRDERDGFLDRCEVGTSFGSLALVQGGPASFSATAIEDSLCLVVPAEVFHQLTAAHPTFAAFFDLQRTSRMRGAVASLQISASGGAILKTKVTDLVGRAPITAPTTASIREAALTMSQGGVSSLLLLDADGGLAGIVTDRDLRNRVIAEGRSYEDSVATIMTPDPVTATTECLAFELLMEMTSRNIHHLPVLHHGEPIGIVTTTDLMRLEQSNPVYLVGDITKAPDVATIAQVSSRLAGVVEALVSQDASADDIGRVVTAVGDAVERRLLGLAEERLGPPPVPYCWVALGSRARQEQALAADQDNAIVIDNSVDPADPEHAAYFTALAEQVCADLVTCGYKLCPGDIMATNPRWRAPLAQWKIEFTRWITEPVPDAVLRASIFFDMRPVYGDPRLFHKLRKHILKLTPDAKRFLAHLAKRATENEPPVGFFRGFVLEKAGEHKDTLDIKRGGIGSVVEIARVYALAAGSRAINTQARIAAAVDRGALSAERGQDLRDAFEFISYVRLRHQAAQVRAGLPTDNHVSPDDLSSFEKRHLREAFGIVRSAQSALGHRHSSSFVS
ncbi:MAG TPA: putative nucleotidyltransferase substrate binding domain-containing protein [Dermatophilaceae bacterium]|nr:putative nucleotidyltransferase substrate binding domain-containing protein [Dermatophilaceae bacterium]